MLSDSPPPHAKGRKVTLYYQLLQFQCGTTFDVLRVMAARNLGLQTYKRFGEMNAVILKVFAEVFAF